MGNTLLRGRDGRLASGSASALGRFGGFQPETEHEVRKPMEIKMNEKLEAMIRIWQSFDQLNYDEPDKDYPNALLLARKIAYSSKDVEMFSIVLVRFQEEPWFGDKAGILLSALVNAGTDNDYVIHTASLSRPINFFGLENQKDIIVSGDAGTNTGDRMVCGSIAIRGNTGCVVGSAMEGGSIIVDGSVADDVGSGMAGGSIFVKGGVSKGSRIGSGMKNGEIAINGNAIVVGPGMKGGSIIVNGDVLLEAGNGMSGGRIVVRGNADTVGWKMEGGSVFLEGDCESIGHEMSGGSIVVKGNVGEVSEFMTGGEVRLEGDFRSTLEEIKAGKIFHKGVLIVDK